MLALAVSQSAYAQSPTKKGVIVTVSIAPLAGLIEPLLDENDSLQLLLNASSSPHGFQLKPSHLKALHQSELVVMNGAGIDAWLNKSLFSIYAPVVQFANLKDIKRLPVREGGAWQAGHDHEHGQGSHAEHKDLVVDGHLWLELDNAVQLVKVVSRELQRLAPYKKQQIATREAKFVQALQALDKQVQEMLSAVKSRPYLVLHDAFQYFEKHYGLNAVGSIQLNPSIAPSIRRVYELRNKVLAKEVVCVFKEPQFPERRIQAVTRGTDVKIGVADPLGVGSAGQSTSRQSSDKGFVGYEKLYHSLAHEVFKCLQP
ncbi:zinc ABC transporter substrate-binding protein [Thiomicrorhabdus sediminis]|nr:zinc ABC transporter substrate-binding protein [Thiomicrorhabdus sediminis]